MTPSTARWFAPEPDDDVGTRLTLDFGLRAADLFFRELVVPELGRVWFVRQLSWPVAALRLHAAMREQGGAVPRPAVLANAVEALACKIEFFRGGETRSARIIGVRAFGRDPECEVTSFGQLQRAAFYVRNTYRQAATRVLQRQGGLGLAAGPRFDGLRLEPIGEALADAMLSQRAWGKVTLAKWLERWIRADPDLPGLSDVLHAALSPERPTPAERAIVRARVLGVASEACEKRRRLEQAVGTEPACPDILDVVVPRLEARGHGQQAREVRAAMAFGALMGASRALAAAVTNVVAPAARGVALAPLSKDHAVRHTSGRLQRVAADFLTRSADAGVNERAASLYARALVGAVSPEVVAELVVSRAPRLLSLASGQVMRGPLFRVLDRPGDDAQDDDQTGPDRAGGTFRIANFHALLLDMNEVSG